MCAYPRNCGDVCPAVPSWSSFGCTRAVGTACPLCGAAHVRPAGHIIAERMYSYTYHRKQYYT
eukprot:4356071-Pyramimonas_sp.AAC.1